MTAPNVKRQLRCPKGHAWQITVGNSEWCPMCDYLGEPFCACGCGASLADLRADAVFRSEACSKRLQRRGRPDADPTETLDDVRAQHEESKGRWTVIVREQLNRCLLVKETVSAEDFDDLGIPAEHSNLANAQMGSYSRQGLMEPISWHRSKKPSRKSGKVWTFRVTAKGREQLASSLVGSSSGPPGGDGIAAARSGENEDAGLTTAAEESSLPRDGRSGQSGDQVDAGPTLPDKAQPTPPSEAAAGVDPPDSLVQLDTPRKAPSMYDAWEDEAA